MQNKTKQIIAILILGLALLTVGFFGFSQIKNSSDELLATRLIPKQKDNIESSKAENSEIISDTAQNNVNQENNHVSDPATSPITQPAESKHNLSKKEEPMQVVKTVVKITESTPQQQLNYDKNSVLQEGEYLKCLKDEHILQWSAGDNEWDCVRPGESVFGKVVATKKHGVRETSTGVVYCNEENNLLVWEDDSWRCKPYLGGGGVNTDNQTLAFQVNTNLLSISNGNTVDLSSLAVDSDTLRDLHCNANEIAKWNSASSLWECAIDAGGVGSTTFVGLTDTPNNYGTNGYLVRTDGVGNLSYIDPSGYLDNTDNQQLSLNGATNILTLGNGTGADTTVDLSPYLDNTDDQTVDNFSLVGTVLHLSLEDDGVADNTLDLSSIDTNTTYTAGTGLALSAGNEFSLNAGINNLTDVDTVTTAPTNGQVLKWSGTNWVPGNDNGGSGGSDNDWTVNGNNMYSTPSGNV